MTHEESPRGRISELDGIRGIAILLVMSYHFFVFPGIDHVQFFDHHLSGFERLSTRLLLTGWAGVDLFFVLSGFLITGILVSTREQPHYFRNFFARRTLRIFPLYYLFLAVWTLLTVLFPGQFGRGPSHHALALWSYTTNWLLGLTSFAAVPIEVQHLWSLAIEEQFYLVWPVVIFALGRRPTMVVSMVLVFFCLVLRAWLVVDGHPLGAIMLTPARLDSLTTGGALALYFQALPRDARTGRVVLPIGATVFLTITTVVAALTLVYLFDSRDGLGSDDAPVAILGRTALAIAFAGLLAFGASFRTTFRFVGRAFSNPVFRWFGRYSYSLYLVHQPICIVLERTGTTARLLPHRLEGSGLPMIAFYFALPCAASSILAIALWYGWELPFLRLKARFR